ncbi:MAG TPA: HAMP domain-containing sensor histidine kinase [Solirubrobacteraceae bacterium]|jgi:signal transduction histidine kinase|nr:HAMP domain-containing sensor histidine kinase [Solirubrobacteraceae bacterium]
MNLPLRLRFALLAALLVLLVASTVGLAAYLSFRSSVLNRAASTAQTEATRLVGLVEGGGRADGQLVDIADTSLTRQLSSPGQRIEVDRPNGAVVQSSSQAMGLTAAFKAQCLGTGHAQTRLSPPPLLVVCARVGPAGASVGTIAVGVPLKDSLASLSTLRMTLVLGVLGGVALAALLSLLLARRALRPLKRIAAAAETIRAGDLTRRIGYSGHDEVGQLANVLDACFTELEQSIERQRRFAADASHELKTPIAAIRANVEVLRGWASAEPAAREATLESLDQAARRASRLVADLLALERIDREPQSLHTRVRLDAVVLGAVRDASALRHGAAVRVGQLDDAILDAGDPIGLHQVVLNVIANALEVSPHGNEVVVSLVTTDAYARVTVSDAGPGIAGDDLEKIFERFYTKRVGRGSQAGAGLGLAIARAIAEEHGGDLTARNNPGRGASFVLRLPLRVTRPGSESSGARSAQEGAVA